MYRQLWNELHQENLRIIQPATLVVRSGKVWVECLLGLGRLCENPIVPVKTIVQCDSALIVSEGH